MWPDFDSRHQNLHSEFGWVIWCESNESIHLSQDVRGRRFPDLWSMGPRPCNGDIFLQLLQIKIASRSVAPVTQASQLLFLCQNLFDDVSTQVRALSMNPDCEHVEFGECAKSSRRILLALYWLVEPTRGNILWLLAAELECPVATHQHRNSVFPV